MPTKPETLKGPDLKTWDDVDDLIEASTTGWNPLQKLPLLLEKYIPWAKDFTFGFFIESDLPEVKSYGWVHVKPDQIAGENWNENAGLRFGLDISGGVVKFRDNYLLCMPKAHRAKQMDRRHQEHEEMIARTTSEHAYAHPADPEFSRMQQAAKELSSGETYRVGVRKGES